MKWYAGIAREVGRFRGRIDNARQLARSVALNQFDMAAPDQPAGVRTIGLSDYAHAGGEIPDVGPRHGLEIHREIKRRAEIAQCGEAFDKPTLMRIVTRNQYVLRAESRAGLECRHVVAHVGVRLQPEDLDIEHTNARADVRPRAPTACRLPLDT